MSPYGVCQTNGIGSLVRDFRIGTNQAMMAPYPAVTSGSPYDDGDEPNGGSFNQSAAFTCNIVAAKVVQCVKGAAYASGIPSSIGQWASGATFIEYGDPAIGTSRIASLQGYVGGQSFPITTPGQAKRLAMYAGVAGTAADGSGGVMPKMDMTVGAGGTLVNAYPSTAADAMGMAVGTACLFTVPGIGRWNSGHVADRRRAG